MPSAAYRPGASPAAGFRQYGPAQGSPAASAARRNARPRPPGSRRGVGPPARPRQRPQRPAAPRPAGLADENLPATIPLRCQEAAPSAQPCVAAAIVPASSGFRAAAGVGRCCLPEIKTGGRAGGPRQPRAGPPATTATPGPSPGPQRPARLAPGGQLASAGPVRPAAVPPPARAAAALPPGAARSGGPGPPAEAGPPPKRAYRKLEQPASCGGGKDGRAPGQPALNGKEQCGQQHQPRP